MKKENIYLAVSAGILTFVFGFGAGALLNLYLLHINSPLVTELRSALTYKSYIFGDGLVLPITNAIAAYFIAQNWKAVKRLHLVFAFFMGFLITAYFHITQALNGIVNWTMPTPWHWNFMGYWHAVYMFSVISLLSLFFISSIYIILRKKKVVWELYLVILGVMIFLALLRLDYKTVSLSSVGPKEIGKETIRTIN